jgi:hypothetical protein
MNRLILCLSILFFTFVSLELGATTHIVTSNGDDYTDRTTLRGIIEATGDYALADGDEILFSLPNTSSTIEIDEALFIQKDITIDGSNLLGGGKYVTIKQTGNNESVIDVYCTLTLENMIITGGDASSYGGGIYVELDKILNLDNVTITQNEASSNGGGIYIGTGASVTINNSTISNNQVNLINNHLKGGGIYADVSSTLIIKNSLISNNSVSASNILSCKGGGIYFDGSELIIENSTIASNQISAPNTASEVFGGGICISADDATVNIVNSTIYSNTAYNDGGNAWGGGILSGSNLNVLNSILVMNFRNGNENDDVFMPAGTCRLYYCWYNNIQLISPNPDIQNHTTAYSSGDLTGNALDYYGGYNNTLAVSSAGNNSSKAGSGTYAYYNETDGYYYYDGSEYKKISDNSTFTPSNPDSDKIIRDQRGYYRCNDVWYGETPTNSTTHGITRGAYQYYGVVARSNSEASWQSGSEDYYTDIQGGINRENTNLVLANTAILGQDINLNKNSLVVLGDQTNTDDCIVRVASPGSTDARVFNVTSTNSDIRYMTIMGGDKGNENGGCIKLDSDTDLRLLEVNLLSGRAALGGGVYVNTNGTITLEDCLLAGNEAYVVSLTTEGWGGSIYLFDNGNLIADRTTFSFNKAKMGGAIYFDGPNEFNIVNSTFYKNSTPLTGGAFYIHSNTFGSFTSTTISENTSGFGSGGIYCFSNGNGTLTMKNNLIGNNSYDYSGTSGIIDLGHNIVENSIGYTWSGTGDITGDQANLFGNGVPTRQLEFNKRESWVSYVPTPTLRIEDERDNVAVSRSPAIKAGVFDADVIYDQRGKLRDDPPTIGAYDIGLIPPVPQASNVTFSDVETDRFTVSWTRSTDEAANGCTAFIYEGTTTEWPRPITMEQYTPEKKNEKDSNNIQYDICLLLNECRRSHQGF